MKRIVLTLSLFFSFLSATVMNAQTVRLDASVKHQRITGFGGFVCSPQFTYNHMSTTEIKKVWGETSTVGCNIMRLYIPIGRNAWGQSLQTAKLAKQMGLIVFASPWGQPAEWKTNGTINAKNDDGTTGKLKTENWADYAKYLEDYVQYLRTNGVELDAISIQNEPDWPANYAGCLWSATEIANFVKTYGPSISCKVMAPETLSCNDNYANALNKADVLPGFAIYGGHQYGGIESAYKKLAEKGKEIWMTEYLINWNENSGTTRNFDFSKDFFNFFRSINTCMLGDFNAWIHYAAKRYYAMLGDGQNGTSTGVVTKRGYIMAHFAKFITGMTRIDATFGTSGLEGSAYLSQSGDSVVVVMANAGNAAVSPVIDLPFYTTACTVVSTTKTTNYSTTQNTFDEETCRPVVTVPAQSVTTVLCLRSRDRQPSNMTAKLTRFDRIDDMKATNTNFGTLYKLSGKSKTFDHSNPLISSRTTTATGYLALNNRFSQLVMEVKKVSSSMNYSSALTTLVYVNAKGELSSHDYGDIDLSRRENFSLVFDLSPATLPDGCIGLLSLTNNNWSSKLTITFGDVYFGNTYSAVLTGDYVADDSNVLDVSHDASCTSINLTAVSALPSSLPWLQDNNRVAYTSEGSPLTGANIVAGTVCDRLALTADGGAFRPATAFTARQASFTTTVDGKQLVMLPFTATVPDGVQAFTVADDLKLVPVSTIAAHTPVLIEASGNITFTGTDTEVAYATSPLTAVVRGAYTVSPLFAGDYVLGQNDGQWGFVRLKTATTLNPFGVYATPASEADFIPLGLTPSAIQDASLSPHTSHLSPHYDLQGRRLTDNVRGLVIVRQPDGTVRKTIRK